MAAVTNLADPDLEPSDEELVALAHEAFADVGARQRQALERLRQQVDTLRAEALARIACRLPPRGSR